MLRSTHKDQLFFTVANNQNKTLNIVKMLLENYGYRVVDLGRDVDPHEIVRVAKEQNIRLIGLSALMTTTVKAMEQTINLLKEEIPDAKTFVGGAALTPEYAETMVQPGMPKTPPKALALPRRSSRQISEILKQGVV